MRVNANSLNVGITIYICNSFRALQALTQPSTVRDNEDHRRERTGTKAQGFLVQAGQGPAFRMHGTKLFVC